MFDKETSKRLTKSFLKSMPIWDSFDEFRAQFQQLEFDYNDYLRELNQRLSRVNNLPALNASFKHRILPALKDIDIVRYYKKIGNEYARCASPDRIADEEKTVGPSKDESILKLEEKISNNEEVFAMHVPGKPWIRCRVVCISRKPVRDSNNEPIVLFRLRTDSGTILKVDQYRIARIQHHGDLLQPPKRVIGGINAESLMPGTIGYEPVDVNDYRYLVLMDDGSANYFFNNQIYPIVGQSVYPWQDSRYLDNHNSLYESHRRLYFSQYPKRLLMVENIGSDIGLIRNGPLESAKIIDIDCDIFRLRYKDGSEENVYRGSARLLKRTDVIAKQLSSSKDLTNFFNKIVVNTHLYHDASCISLDINSNYWPADNVARTNITNRSRNTARKSTTIKSSPQRIQVSFEGKFVEEELNPNHVYDWDIERTENYRTHKCSVNCLVIPGVKTELSVNDIVEEFREDSDLKVPLLLGWKRNMYRVLNTFRNQQSTKVQVIYEAPCGKPFQRIDTIRRYLINTKSKMDIDYFSFDRELRICRKLGEYKAFFFSKNLAVDSRYGRPLENKNISLMNIHNEERLPTDFEYRNESFPHPMLKSKGFTFNHEFKSSCDCEDDCFARASCACHRLNDDFSGKNSHLRGKLDDRYQYKHKRLMDQVSTGIFECNSYCKCSSKCSNRVVQNGIRFRLQVYKTPQKGWGVITLDDIPKGAFICTYAAELLDDADQYGDSDMYYADLDYISVNERIKLGYSSDEGVESEDEEDQPVQPASYKCKRKVVIEETSSDDEPKDNESISSLEANTKKAKPNESLKIEESRYPKRQVIPRQKSVQNTASEPPRFKHIHDLLGCRDYTLDARMQGNVGRFFNHSCDPNSIVQNVFIETHDLRFPTVAFFAMRHIKATDEITWNYNYKMGAIEGRRIDCHCAASNCKGRIL